MQSARFSGVGTTSTRRRIAPVGPRAVDVKPRSVTHERQRRVSGNRDNLIKFKAPKDI